MDYGSRCGGTGEFAILGEDEKPLLLKQRAIGDEFFALSQHVRIALGRWAIFKDSGGTAKHHKTVRRALSSRLSTLEAAKEQNCQAEISAAGCAIGARMSDPRTGKS